MKRFMTTVLVGSVVAVGFAGEAPVYADAVDALNNTTYKQLCEGNKKLIKGGLDRARGYRVVQVHCPDQEKAADLISCDGSKDAHFKTKALYEDCKAYINRSDTPPAPSAAPAPPPAPSAAPAPPPAPPAAPAPRQRSKPGRGGGPGGEPKAICDPSSQPAPHWGEKNGRCMKSCGGAGGTASYGDACSNHNMQEVGPAYDVPHCCK